jgi:hypothetical protein
VSKIRYSGMIKKKINEDFHLFKIFTSITNTIVADICTSPISASPVNRDIKPCKSYRKVYTFDDDDDDPEEQEETSQEEFPNS